MAPITNRENRVERMQRRPRKLLLFSIKKLLPMMASSEEMSMGSTSLRDFAARSQSLTMRLIRSPESCCFCAYVGISRILPKRSSLSFAEV